MWTGHEALPIASEHKVGWGESTGAGWRADGNNLEIGEAKAKATRPPDHLKLDISAWITSYKYVLHQFCEIGLWSLTSIDKDQFLSVARFRSWIGSEREFGSVKNDGEFCNEILNKHILESLKLCICMQLWEIIHVSCMKSSILALWCCTSCHSIMSPTTLILFYYASIS